MSTRREDDSRPKGNLTSQRTTARDVPIAKYKEVPVGTSPPGALRGPSLLPGRGAPEKIIPEDVELAVLRDAETLDGPHVARAAKRRAEPSNSPSPMPVSVEVPRPRSLPPMEVATTPTSPSARSIQSGTLMSIGSIDPRAPTELSLPTPRPLSVSERAAYFGPEAVVDRSPSQPEIESRPSVTERASYPDSKPVSSGRGAPSRAGVSQAPESSAPAAQNFARAPRSYSPSLPPVSSPPESPPRSAGQTSRRSQPSVHSTMEGAPRYQIHSELDAVPRELLEDAFDLRSAYTQREPLASRKRISSAEWIPTPDAHNLEARSSRPSHHSTSAMTVKLDRVRDSMLTEAEIALMRRRAVPLSWVIAAALGVLVALVAVYLLRATPPQGIARVPDDRASASAPSAAPLLVPPSPPEALQATKAARLRAGAPLSARPTANGSVPKGAPGLASAGARPAEALPNGTLPTAPADSAKSRQSIY